MVAVAVVVVAVLLVVDRLVYIRAYSWHSHKTRHSLQPIVSRGLPIGSALLYLLFYFITYGSRIYDSESKCSCTA